MAGSASINRRLGAVLATAGLVTVLAVLSPAATAAPACTDTFTGASGGLWQTAANWTTAGNAHVVPSVTDVACWSAGTTVVVAASATADSVQGGSLQVTAGTLTLAATVNASTVQNLSLDDTGGLTAGAPTVTITGNFEWGTGNDSPALDATVVQTGGGTFAIDGSASLGGPNFTGGSITTSSPVSITNQGFQSTGAESVTTTNVITLGPNLQLSGLAPATTFTAAGLGSQTGNYGFWDAGLVLTGGTTTVPNNGTLEVGSITVEGGTFVENGGTTLGGGGLNTTTLTGGTVTGTGVLGNVTNTAGTVVVPSGAAADQLTIDGDYSQGAGGTLAVGLDGSDSSLLKLNGTGTQTIGGTLSIVDDSGDVVPPAGTEAADIILTQTAPIVGTFSTLTGAAAGFYTAQYARQTVQLFTKSASGPGSGTTTQPTGGTGTASTPTQTVSTGPTTTVPGGPPVDRTAPTVRGTPTPGHTLTCSAGTWTNSPSSYGYRWHESGAATASDTTAAYPVQIADEGGALTCTVTAANAAGAGAPATSAVVVVAQPGTLHCPRPTGRLGATTVGRLALGLTQSQARHRLTRFVVTHNHFDNFCLYGGWGIRVGYPVNQLLTALPRAQRARLAGRVVLALTANPYYALDGVRPGMSLTVAARRLRLGRAFPIGSNDWYLAAGTASRGVLKVRGGIVQEVGIADARLTGGSAASQHRFLASFKAA